MIDITTTFQTAIINALSQIISNAGYIALAIWGFNKITREIKNGIKQVPNWLEQYDKIKQKHYQIDKAVKLRNKGL